jgi:hypothetical protein
MMRLEDPGIWNDPKQAQALGRERASLETTVVTIDTLSGQIKMPLSCWSWLAKKPIKDRLTS